MSRSATFLRNIRLNNSYLIAAWPGLGEVAYDAANFLIQQLGAQEFCRLNTEHYFYPPGVSVDKGILDLPPAAENRFFFWKDKQKDIELIIFISTSQPDLAYASRYTDLIMDVCNQVTKNIKCVLTFAALPSPIEHIKQPRALAAATSKLYFPRLKAAGFEIIKRSRVSGMNGLFLGLVKMLGLEGLCLLAQVPFYTINIDNPKASAEILEKLSRLIGVKLDLTKLYRESQKIDSQINNFLGYFRDSFLQQPEDQPISQEELEKIKHTLGQYTKLPNSARLNIEKLFEAAKGDLSKAKELKLELDKWSIYTEYEDRFLDLFKHRKERN